jgi:hypothetical protein
LQFSLFDVIGRPDRLPQRQRWRRATPDRPASTLPCRTARRAFADIVIFFQMQIFLLTINGRGGALANPAANAPGFPVSMPEYFRYRYLIK